MSPQEALKIIDQAVSQLNGNREVHIALTNAIGVLSEAIKPKDEPKPDTE